MTAETTRSTSVILENGPRRERSRSRLYVLCQSAGWLFFLLIQLFFVLVLPQRPLSSDERVNAISVLVFVIALGWLITHYTRPLLKRWGWEQLGWRALAPRILGLSAVQSAVWTLVGYGYPYLILQQPWTAKLPIAAGMALSWINGVFMLVGWLCVYFFYHLFDRYNRLQIEQLRLAAHAKEAELRALKSQVNPHFIFNALNSLRALIDEEPARARLAVTQLANLLRYSLQSGQLETVPFEDELRIVKDYLALEQVRHEERLRVRLDIDPATLGLPIPPMLLQTLVENAVKYGISPRPEGGEIAITARRERDALRLQVANPGELAQYPSESPASGSTGLGLRNAAERLRLLFGDQATLELRVASPHAVLAEALLPVTPLRS